MSTNNLDKKKEVDNYPLRRVGDPEFGTCSKDGSKDGDEKSAFGREDTVEKSTAASSTSNVAQSQQDQRDWEQQQNQDLDAKNKDEDVARQNSTSSSIANDRQQCTERQLGAEPSIRPPRQEVVHTPGAFRAGGNSDEKSSVFISDHSSVHLTTEDAVDYLVTATIVEEEPEREIVPAVLIDQHHQDAEQQLSSALDELEKVRRKDAARRRRIKVVLIAIAFCLVIIIVIAVVVALNNQRDNNPDEISQETIKLMSPEETADDSFGGSVAIDTNGTIVAISSTGDNNGTGAVYIFSSWKEDGASIWKQVAKVTPSDAIASDYFGYSLAFSMDGKTLLASAPRYGSEEGGYVSIITRNENNWTERAKLQPENAIYEELFGDAIVISQSTIVIGATNYNVNESGSVYVFTQSEGVWKQEARLSPEDAIEASCDGSFGVSVATSLDGHIIVVGGDRCGSGDMSHGNAYVFAKTSDGSWRQEAKLVPADIQPEAGFGFSVDISNDGTTIVAGSPGDGDSDVNPASGSVYIFKKIDGRWNEHAKLTSDKRVAAMMGQSVKTDGDAQTIVAGLHGQRWGSGFLFTLSGGGWTEQTELIGPDNDMPTIFGLAIALSRDGRTAILGAASSDSVLNVDGSAYIFQL